MNYKYLQVAFNLPLNQTFSYENPEPERNLTGCRVEAPFGNRELTGWVVDSAEKKLDGIPSIKTVRRIVDKEPLFGTPLLELAQWTASLYFCSLGEALSAMLPGGRREKSSDLPDEDEAVLQSLNLSDEQQQALDSITDQEGGFFYLYGITGSGKTEVFLRAAEKTVAEGRGVIYLVPEITLTHQLIEKIRSRFKGRLAVLHSHLTPSQRLTEWRRIQNGEADFVLGARSAVFAPLEKIGLIVLDEEHESSYKSGNTPRYHARQIAWKRAQRHGARLVMGSATPSLEAYHQMSTGLLKKLELNERVAGGAPPEIGIVDLKKEKSLFSQELILEVNTTLRMGKQVLLFLNRRGYSYYFSCSSCGYEILCRHCSVALTYHKGKKRLICHYCGYSEPETTVCPDCGSLEVGFAGLGTEGIEEEAAALFPGRVISRLDTDTAGHRGKDTRKILTAFRDRKIDILLGTQMVAKGLNFPGVGLVGIVTADTSLNLPDFRAEERTFALITQVAGRAGRFTPDGRVLVQTYKPESPAVRLAASGSQEEFYEQELSMRKVLSFPPFSRLFRLVFRSKNEQDVRRESARFRSLMAGFRPDEILGPAECALGRINGNSRMQILIRTNDFSRVHNQLKRVLHDFQAKRGVYLEIDVDPLALL